MVRIFTLGSRVHTVCTKMVYCYCEMYFFPFLKALDTFTWRIMYSAWNLFTYWNVIFTPGFISRLSFRYILQNNFELDWKCRFRTRPLFTLAGETLLLLFSYSQIWGKFRGYCLWNKHIVRLSTKHFVAARCGFCGTMIVAGGTSSILTQRKYLSDFSTIR